MKKSLAVFLTALLTLSTMVFSVGADGTAANENAPAAVQIGETGTASIEFDDNWSNLQGENTTLEGDNTVRSTGWGTAGEATRKINVAKSGLYKVEHVTNKFIESITSHISRQTLAIDGEKFHDNLGACKPSENVSYDIDGLTNFSGKYTETVAITAGEHTLSLDSYGRTGQGMSNSVAMVIDYISFTRVGDIPKVPTTTGEKVRIEAEDLLGSRTAYYKATTDATDTTVIKGSSAGDYYGLVPKIDTKDIDELGTFLRLNSGQKDGTKSLQYVAFTTKIDVAKSGYYDISYRGTAGDGNISYQSIYVDNKNVLSSSSATSKTDVKKVDTWFQVQDIVQKGAYLAKGTHTLMWRLHGSTQQGSVVFYSDYMEIAPAADYTPVPLPEGVALRIEAEDMLDNVTTYHKATADADAPVLTNQYNHGITPATKKDIYSNTAICRTGGPWIVEGVKERFVAVTFDTEAEVETAGWYEIKLCGTLSSSVISKQTVKVDGEAAVTTQQKNRTKKADIDVNFALYEFTGDAIYLTAGKHNVQLYVDTCAQNAPVFYADYIDFATVNVPKTVCNLDYDNKVTVRKCFDEQLSGTFYVAAYKNKELLGLKKTTLNNAFEENVTEWQVSSRPDTIKIMAWNENYAPLCDVETFTFDEAVTDPFAGDNEINVVFLGDSLYQGAGASSDATKWVTLVGNYFDETYEKDGVTVNWYNKGVGGTTTDYSLARVIRDCVDLNPDLVFFSATCNDGARDTRVNMESVVRTLLAMDNPPYIVITLNTNKGLSDSYGYAEQVAEHYGLPVIDDKADLQKLMAQENLTSASYFISDGVHPNDKGYAHIADTVIRRMKSGVYYKRPTMPAEKLVANAVAVKSAQYRTAQDASITLSDGWDKEGTYATANKEGATMSFTFTGNFIAFDYGLHKDSGKIEVYIDDELKFTANPVYDDKLASYQLVGRADSLFYDLENKEHTVVMKTVSQKEDKTLTDRIYGIFTGVCEK